MVTINAHIEFLYDQEHAISLMLELWLARLTSEHNLVVMVHAKEKHMYQTYLTGRTDYMVLTITNGSEDAPSLFDVTTQRNAFLEKLELSHCIRAFHPIIWQLMSISRLQNMFSQLSDHLDLRLTDNQGWEVLFLEAKSTCLFSQGKSELLNSYLIFWHDSANCTQLMCPTCIRLSRPAALRML